MFVHLHNHSYYSLLEGLSSPKQLAERAKELGQVGCALTDRGVMYGCIDFYKACKEIEIKPVLGCEMYIATTNRFDKSPATGTKKHNVLLLAESHEGYKNLLELTTKAHVEGFYYKPRIDKDLLKEHSKGLICLTSDHWGEIPQAIMRGKSIEELKVLLDEYQSIFGKENFFLEMQHRKDNPDYEKINNTLQQLHSEFKVPLVVTNNSHYAREKDQEAHEIMLCLQTGKDYEDPSRFTMRNDNFSMRSEEDLKAHFPKELESAFDNTVEIANRCSYDFVFGKNLIPSFEIPKDDKDLDEEMYFRKLCWQGTIWRYDLPFSEADIPTLIAKENPKSLSKELTETTPEELKEIAESGYSQKKRDLLAPLNAEQKTIVDRIEYEMCVINEMGFCTYFLIVQDFVIWAKEQGIAVGPGRGSAAGAIVAYVLQITDLDPLAYDLLFERFLNPARVSMPDIDLDFEDARRGEVLEYVRNKYGNLNVAQICTFGSMKAKQAVKDVGRSLGIPYQEMDGVAKKITEKLGTKLETIVESNPEVIEVMKDEKFKRVFDLALNIEGVVRQLGVHACAVVISEKPLTEYTALQHPPKDKDSLVSQYSMKPLEMLGLLKMDFLGLRNLTIMQVALKIIERTKEVQVDMSKIPLDDKDAYALFARGDTKGVFQFESEGMRKWLKELKPDCFEDIIAMVSMYRPGPLAWIPVYIGKKHGLDIEFPSDEAKGNFEKLVELLDKYPEIKKILDNTNLIPIYQEQILQIAQKFSGFSLGGADLLRRAIGKKIASELMAQKEKFIEGAANLGRDKQDAKFLFERGIEPFADYGFNKSHAACYALISYQTAYLKAHYPTEFMTALLSTVEDNTEKLIIQIEDCNSMRIAILAPDVNESLVHFTTVTDGQIRFGLNAIKGFGEESARLLVEARRKHGQFENLEGFLSHAPTSIMSRKPMEALVYSGALDSLGEDRKTLTENIETLIQYAKEHHDKVSKGQTDIFGMMSEEDLGSIPSLELPKNTEATSLEKLEWERQYLGFYVSGHPLQGLSAYIRKHAKLVEDLTHEDLNETSIIVARIAGLRKIMTKKGDLMAACTLEGLSASISAVVFPRTYNECAHALVQDNFVKVSGKLDLRDGQPQFVVREMKILQIATMIANAKKGKVFDPDEKRPIGISELEIKEPSENDTEEQESNNNEETEILPYAIEIPEADSTLLGKLKDILEESTKGNHQVLLQVQNKQIKTPYHVERTSDLEQKIEHLLRTTTH